MPVGNTMALCNTQHTGKEILRRPMSVYFANDPDCVVLLCGVQGSNHTLLVPDSYVHYTERHLDEWMYKTYFLYIHRVHKNKAIEFFALFYLGLMKFYNIWRTVVAFPMKPV